MRVRAGEAGARNSNTGGYMQKTLLAVIAATAVMIGLTVNFAGAAGTPADKVAASGSTAEVAAPGEEITLMSEKIRSSTTADLILGVTSECTITTALTTVGNDAAEAEGNVDIWVEIDGDAVPVNSSDQDDGKVTFCNKFERRETTQFDDEDATIETLDRVGTANGVQLARAQRRQRRAPDRGQGQPDDERSGRHRLGARRRWQAHARHRADSRGQRRGRDGARRLAVSNTQSRTGPAHAGPVFLFGASCYAFRRLWVVRGRRRAGEVRRRLHTGGHMQKTLLAVIAASVVAVGLTGSFAGAAGTPADKVAASGSNAEVAAPGENVTLMSEKIRTSNTSDLILGVTSECAITTALTTAGNDAAEAEGTVDVWVEIDGERGPGQLARRARTARSRSATSSSVARRRSFDDEDATIEHARPRRRGERRSTGSRSTQATASTRSRSRPT